MCKILKNEEGSVIVMAIMILAVLTLIGVISMRTSLNEQHITTNSLLYQTNFYAAESGIALSPLWVKSNYPESEWENIDFLGEDGGTLSTLARYDYEVTPQTETDPSDGLEKVLRYGDENGDYLNEINYTVGPPLFSVDSYGTHPRGGEATINATFIFSPILMMPDAALRVNSNVNGNGVSGSIIGEAPIGSSCGDVADIMYDVAGGIIEYGGDLGDTPVKELSSGMYPIPLLQPIILERATMEIVGSNNIDEGPIESETSAEPGVVYIEGDAKATNLVGNGILFVNGNVELAGNLAWTGIIIVNGNMTFSGGGTKTIIGAVIGGGDAVALNGSVDIQYDCDVLTDLNDEFSKYNMTSWKQI